MKPAWRLLNSYDFFLHLRNIFNQKFSLPAMRNFPGNSRSASEFILKETTPVSVNVSVCVSLLDALTARSTSSPLIGP